MDKLKIDKSREARIDDEIIVDCYGDAERAMGWYCYLEDRSYIRSVYAYP